MRWPFSRSKDKDRNIRILPYERHNAGEYYENLVFRLSKFLGLLVEKRQYADSRYWKHMFITNRVWINLVTNCKRERYGVVCSGRSCVQADNAFKEFLSKFCRNNSAGRIHSHVIGRSEQIASCTSVQELDLVLTTLGY